MDADELRALLSRARMTQKDAAERCGVTLRTVQNWVSGARPVPVMAEQALIIAEAERDAVAFDRDTQTPADARAALEWIASEQRRRIALLEREIDVERAALAETLERIGK
jgi:transcriptional regulator with XRE-family HTH domain